MFPRNAATPPVIDLGQILQISDGAIQTTGASVRVKIGTGAWGAGAGTLACDTTSGIWTYAPTQGETNADYFIIGAYKSGCTALSKTVITSDSTTSGRVYVATNGDKTGYSLTQTFPSNFASLAITVGGAVTVGTNNDKTGYALTQSFPANFAALGINASGHVSRVTLVDTTTTNTDMRGTDNAALASNWTATRAGYLDGVLLASNYNQRTVQVTGSNHVAADVHEFQPGVITSGDFAAGAITSTVLATDSITSSQIAASAVTEIQSGLATSSQAVAIKAVTDKLDTAVVLDGAVYQFTANALELGPSGNATVIVQPLSATQPEAVIGTRIPRAVGDVSPISVDIYDSNDAAVNLTTLGNLEVCVETEANVDLQVVAHANLTISGASNNKVTWTPNAASVATVAKHRWSLRVASNKKDIAHGVFEVLRVALSDV